MSDFTETPLAPPPAERKAPKWKVIIPVAIVVVLCCVCLVIASVLAYMGMQGTGPLAMLATATNTPIPTPTFTPTVMVTVEGDWDLYYNWDCGDTYNGPAQVTFFVDYTYLLTEASSDPGYGTWFLSRDGIDFTFDNEPYAHYIGTVDSSVTYMEGTMVTTTGSSGCWYAVTR